MTVPRDKRSRPLSTLEQHASTFTADASSALGGPRWLCSRRAEAFARFEATSLPTGDDEIWRYSRIDELDLGRFSPAPSGARAQAQAAGGLWDLPPAVHALLDRIGERAGFVLSRDGAVVQADLGEAAEASGVRLASALTHRSAEVLVGQAPGAFDTEDTHDIFDDLADAFGEDATVLTVPAGVEVREPIVIVNVLAPGHATLESGPALFPRTVVELGANSSAQVIELLISGDGAMLVVPVSELTVGAGARCSYSVVQQLGRRSWNLGHSSARVERDATLHTFTASLGGAYARSRTDSRLDGQGSSAEILAAFLGDGSQMHDFRTLQEHIAPRTSSDLVFKGAVGDTARSVYSGLIRMRHGARGATAFQTNRNLVLSDGAHADSVPNLDIQENDVRCSHASAVGPIDAEQRFYLQSRGVPREAAERLILLGFFRELLERAVPAVGDHVVASIRGRVSAITAEEGAA